MIDPRSTKAYKLEKENRELKREIERLNKKIEQYENPEDMTLMFMWCDEKAKDEIKRLNNIINELEKDINKRIERYDVDETINGIVIGTLKYVLNKLHELKGSE